MFAINPRITIWLTASKCSCRLIYLVKNLLPAVGKTSDRMTHKESLTKADQTTLSGNLSQDFTLLSEERTERNLLGWAIALPPGGQPKARTRNLPHRKSINHWANLSTTIHAVFRDWWSTTKWDIPFPAHLAKRMTTWNLCHFIISHNELFLANVTAMLEEKRKHKN